MGACDEPRGEGNKDLHLWCSDRQDSPLPGTQGHESSSRWTTLQNPQYKTAYQRIWARTPCHAKQIGIEVYGTGKVQCLDWAIWLTESMSQVRSGVSSTQKLDVWEVEETGVISIQSRKSIYWRFYVGQTEEVICIMGTQDGINFP